MSVIELALWKKKPVVKVEQVYECLKCKSFHFQIRESGSIACSNCASVMSNLVVKTK